MSCGKRISRIHATQHSLYIQNIKPASAATLRCGPTGYDPLGHGQNARATLEPAALSAASAEDTSEDAARDLSGDRTAGGAGGGFDEGADEVASRCRVLAFGG